MIARLALSFVPLLMAVQPGHAQSVADFYRGKTIQMLIGYTVGGGYDLNARVLARHLSKHIPGNPNIVPQNMAGAGSLRLANFLYNVAPKDGTAIGIVGRGMAMEPLIGGSATQYDARRYTWIGSVSDQVSLCATWHTSKVKSWDDMRKTDFTVGGEGSGSDPDMFATMIRSIFSVKIRLVSGYPGGNEINLAMERGEVDGRCGWSWSSIKSQKWLRDGKINPLVQFGMEKHADLPDVPLALDRAGNDEQRQVVRLLTAGQVVGRPFFAPPDIPSDRKGALRKAFDATMQDPQFLAEAAKLDLEISPLAAPAIDEFLAEIYRTPQDVVRKAVAAVQK
jgi:tripartite-type tricarboxylate transporter receptor subunit TctC